MFSRIEYLEWIETRLETVSHDFGTSDLKRQIDGVVPDRLCSVAEPAPTVTLEEQIAARYGPETDPENVLVTVGATMANVVAMATALGPDGSGGADGNRVVVEDPVYEPLRETPRGLGATVVQFSRDRSHRLDPAAVEETITDETCLVVLTNRHNPSGRLTCRETLASVADAATEYDAHLLVDEVYAPYESTPRTGTGTAFGGVTAAGLENTLVSNSLTKFFGYGPLRIGWIVGPPEFVERARSTIRHFPDVAGPSRHLARRVFANDERIADRSRARIGENHDLLASFLEERDALDGFVPPGSTMAFPSHATVSGDELAAAALDASVLVVPGRFFDRPDAVRVVLSNPPAEMREALSAFNDVLDSIATDGAG